MSSQAHMHIFLRNAKKRNHFSVWTFFKLIFTFGSALEYFLRFTEIRDVRAEGFHVRLVDTFNKIG